MRLSHALAATAAAATLAAGHAAAAASVDWVDWTYVDVSQNVHGTIANGGASIGVIYAGPRQFAQVTGGGPDNWIDQGVTTGGVAFDVAQGYTQGLVNRPDGTDIVALNAGGTKTITFSQAVTDPYLAFLDWKGVDASFSAPFTLVSEGCGLRGCGTISPNAGGTGFLGVGDASGVIRFKGTFTTLTFTDTSYNFHGFRVGLGEPTSAAPEPAAWALMILGFGGAGAALRSRRKAMTT